MNTPKPTTGEIRPQSAQFAPATPPNVLADHESLSKIFLDELRQPTGASPLPTGNLQARIERLKAEINEVLEAAVNLHNTAGGPLHGDARIRQMVVHLGEARRRIQSAQPCALALAGQSGNGEGAPWPR